MCLPNTCQLFWKLKCFFPFRNYSCTRRIERFAGQFLFKLCTPNAWVRKMRVEKTIFREKQTYCYEFFSRFAVPVGFSRHKIFDMRCPVLLLGNCLFCSKGEVYFFRIWCCRCLAGSSTLISAHVFWCFFFFCLLFGCDAPFSFRFSRRLSFWCASHPGVVITIGVLVCGACSAGISVYKTVADPVELWSSPDSQIRKEMDYFESHFKWVQPSIISFQRERHSFQRERQTFLLLPVRKCVPCGMVKPGPLAFRKKICGHCSRHRCLLCLVLLRFSPKCGSSWQSSSKHRMGQSKVIREPDYCRSWDLARQRTCPEPPATFLCGCLVTKP